MCQSLSLQNQELDKNVSYSINKIDKVMINYSVNNFVYEVSNSVYC